MSDCEGKIVYEVDTGEGKDFAYCGNLNLLLPGIEAVPLPDEIDECENLLWARMGQMEYPDYFDILIFLRAFEEKGVEGPLVMRILFRILAHYMQGASVNFEEICNRAKSLKGDPKGENDGALTYEEILRLDSWGGEAYVHSLVEAGRAISEEGGEDAISRVVTYLEERFAEGGFGQKRASEKSEDDEGLLETYPDHSNGSEKPGISSSSEAKMEMEYPIEEVSTLGSILLLDKENEEKESGGGIFEGVPISAERKGLVLRRKTEDKNFCFSFATITKKVYSSDEVLNLLLQGWEVSRSEKDIPSGTGRARKLFHVVSKGSIVKSFRIAFE